MTPDEFDKMVDQAMADAAEYLRKIESGELPLTPTASEIKTWPLVEMDIIPIHQGFTTYPTNLTTPIMWSPMEYSHDDEDKGTK